MTDRINALTVILDRDIREDDVQPLVDAIKMLRGVQDVQLNVADINSAIAESRARHDLGQKIVRVVYPESERRDR